jgi:hypothetical protein
MLDLNIHVLRLPQSRVNALKEKLESNSLSNNLKIDLIPRKSLINKEKFKFCKSLTIIIVKLYQLMSFNNKNLWFNTRPML